MYWNGPFTLGFLKRYEVQRRCAGLTKLHSGRAIIRLFGRSADLLPLRWRAASARSHPAGTRLLSPLRGQACHLTISAPRRREIFIRAVSVRHTPHFTRHSSHPSASPRFRVSAISCAHLRALRVFVPSPPDGHPLRSPLRCQAGGLTMSALHPSPRLRTTGLRSVVVNQSVDAPAARCRARADC